VNGRTLNEALYGIAYIVSPGSTVIEASAPGFITFRREASVAAGANADVPVALERDPHAAVVPTTNAHATVPVMVNVPLERIHRPSLAAPVAVLAVGGAFLVTSGILALARPAAIAHLESLCDPGDPHHCPDTEPVRSALGIANGLTIATDVAFFAGVGVVVLGGIWLIANAAAPGRRERATASIAHGLRLAVTPTGASIGVGGAL
jgi:hypothetical protein